MTYYAYNKRAKQTSRRNNVSHPNKHIREAIQYAQTNGWRYDERGKSHKKGTLYCSCGVCVKFVYGTPRNPEAHANQIRRAVDACPNR